MDDQQTDSDIMTQLGQQLVDELRAKTPSRSGRTREAITFEVLSASNIILQIYGPPYIETFVTGRGPTRNSGGGGKSLRESILEWIEDANITPSARNGKTPTRNQLSYMMANYIHKHGNKLYRELGGGKTDYFDSVFTEARFSAFFDIFATKYTKVVFSDIIDKFNTK